MREMHTPRTGDTSLGGIVFEYTHGKKQIKDVRYGTRILPEGYVYVSAKTIGQNYWPKRIPFAGGIME